MRRFLPTAWIILALVSLILLVLSMAPLYETDFQPVFLTKLPSALISTLFILSLAILYALLNRMGARGLVFGFGWVHLVAFFFTKVSEANFEQLRNQMLVSGEPFRAQELAIAGGLSLLTSFMSAAAFFTVILIAFFDQKPDAEPQAFD